MSMNDNSEQGHRRIEVSVRVRYVECDPMGVAHHSVYPVWLEIARTDLLRRRGNAYRDLEAAGVMFVVARMSLRYHKPARYDDELTIICIANPSAGVKVEHSYEIRRGDELLATGQTTLVCVDRDGKLKPIPGDLFP
jgi:acyl-CoA thioester hydrolase